VGDLLFAIVAGFVFGWAAKPDRQAPINDILQSQVELLEEKLAYYKKLTKELANENNQFRRKLPEDGYNWKASKDIV
jgi:hypothetical protein